MPCLFRRRLECEARVCRIPQPACPRSCICVSACLVPGVPLQFGWDVAREAELGRNVDYKLFSQGRFCSNFGHPFLIETDEFPEECEVVEHGKGDRVMASCRQGGPKEYGTKPRTNLADVLAFPNSLMQPKAKLLSVLSGVSSPSSCKHRPSHICKHLRSQACRESHSVSRCFGS